MKQREKKTRTENKMPHPHVMQSVQNSIYIHRILIAGSVSHLWSDYKLLCNSPYNKGATNTKGLVKIEFSD